MEGSQFHPLIEEAKKQRIFVKRISEYGSKHPILGIPVLCGIVREYLSPAAAAMTRMKVLQGRAFMIDLVYYLEMVSRGGDIEEIKQFFCNSEAGKNHFISEGEKKYPKPVRGGRESVAGNRKTPRQKIVRAGLRSSNMNAALFIPSLHACYSHEEPTVFLFICRLILDSLGDQFGDHDDIDVITEKAQFSRRESLPDLPGWVLSIYDSDCNVGPAQEISRIPDQAACLIFGNLSLFRWLRSQFGVDRESMKMVMSLGEPYMSLAFEGIPREWFTTDDAEALSRFCSTINDSETSLERWRFLAEKGTRPAVDLNFHIIEGRGMGMCREAASLGGISDIQILQASCFMGRNSFLKKRIDGAYKEMNLTSEEKEGVYEAALFVLEALEGDIPVYHHGEQSNDPREGIRPTTLQDSPPTREAYLNISALAMRTPKGMLVEVGSRERRFPEDGEPDEE